MSLGAQHMLMFFAISIAVGVLFVGVPLLLMWAVGRFIRREAAIGIGFLAIAYFVYLIVDMHWICSAEPIIRPGSDPESMGAADFACDAPGGIFNYLFIWGVGPLQVAILMVATSMQYRQLLRQR